MITSEKKTIWENCYLCGSSNDLFTSVYSSKNITKCKNCGFVFYEIIPSLEELDKVYSTYSREEYITQNSVMKIRNEMSKILNSFEISSVLDIACGECYMLDILKSIDSSLDLFATEHDSAKDNVLSKGYNFIDGEFFPSTDKKFDLVIFTEAIEHINDANEFLQHVYELLSPGGLIYFTTPNFASLESRLMKENWGMIVPPEHLSYFTPNTLNFVMKKNGFGKKFCRTENISIFRIVQFWNRHFTKKDKNIQAASPQKISDTLQSITTSNPFFRLIKDLVNVFLNVFNLGSSLKALYQKK